jgi:hypothetical protein
MELLAAVAGAALRSARQCSEIREDAVPDYLNPQPLPPGYGRPVRVQAPAEILNNLGKFQEVQASLLAKAGHPACTSGMQFLWQAYEEWVVDPSGEVSPLVTSADEA